MRVPLSWLREYVDLTLAPRDLAELLTLRGMEVVAIETIGADWTDVVVGRVREVRRHPNADALWLARVDVGAAGGELSIVTGAQNLEAGQLVPAALVGAVLPGERRIERSRIRGQISEGMLCGTADLGIGTDTDDIHILGHDDEFMPGTPLAQVVGETVLDVDVKPNRGDALSMVGLAREIAAFTGTELRLPDATVVETDEDAAAHVSVRIEEPELNPRFAARWFDGVANGPSPDWMQRRLQATGMRPISAVVDVTNYVMQELGQPLHAYDADTVPDGLFVVRRARAGETLETIDHVTRALDERMLIIADGERPIDLAGIMGGAETEVSEATTRVTLEAAIFHGPTIRNTGRRLGLRSEASMRHEKGLSADLPRYAADRAAKLIAEFTGGRVGRGIVDNVPELPPRRVIVVGVARTERLLGIALDGSRVRDLLTPLGFEVEGQGDEVEVSVPHHRLDVLEPADVAEEIARAHGYERVPVRLSVPAMPAYRPDPSAPVAAIRRILAGLGLDEVVSYALIGPDDLARTRHEVGPHLVRIANPLSEEHSILRPVPYPSLLRSLAENARQRRPDAWLFEVGKVYWYSAERPTQRERQAQTAGTRRYEAWELGIALLGRPLGRTVGDEPRAADVSDIKGLVDALHDAVGAPRPAYRPEEPEQRHPHRHPGRSAMICDAGGRAYGSLGEVHPEVAEAWGLTGRPVDAAIAIDALLDLVPVELRAAGLPAAQPVDRDLSVVVDDGVAVGEVLRITRMTAGPLLAELALFDAYRGEQVGAGRVSYALRLRFQPSDATSDERAVDKALNRVRGALQHHLGAEIR
jgi:phenylalanyl-tRNA synthetase beta chain